MHPCSCSAELVLYFSLYVDVSTKHAVEIHSLHSAVTQCILWHLIVTQKLHQLNKCVPHTCLISGDSAKHFSNHSYPSCKCVNKACSGSTSAVTQCILRHLIESQKLQKYTRAVPHTLRSQLNIFLTTPTLPEHVSTRHAMETHSLHSAVTQCILWHLIVTQKLHQLNRGVPNTCLTSEDSVKHYSNNPYLPIHVTTRSVVEAHSLHLQTPYAFCDTW